MDLDEAGDRTRHRMADVVDQKWVAIVPAPQTPCGSEIVLEERAFQIRPSAIFGRQSESMLNAEEDHRLPESGVPIERSPSRAFAWGLVERMIRRRLKRIGEPVLRIVR